MSASGSNTTNPSGNRGRGGRRYNAPRPPPTQLVSRPSPISQVDSRTFQLNQVKRRFSPEESTLENGSTSLKFKLAPSDPDFPYEMQALQCELIVPSNYPQQPPTLRVSNKEMGRGFQINVENGFTDIVSRMAKSTLLQHINRLDRELEQLLAAPKAETVKIIANVGKTKESGGNSGIQTQEQAVGSSTSTRSTKPSPPPAPKYTAEELEKAKLKRQLDMRQLESRFGRLPKFFRGGDGASYIIPLEPKRRNELPASLQEMSTVKFIFPELYNLEPCRLELPGVFSDDVKTLEQNFQKQLKASPDASFFSHVNKLAQNMHHLAKKSEEDSEVVVPISRRDTQQSQTLPSEESNLPEAEKGKGNVIVIPRPPEWTVVDADDDSGDDNYSYHSSELDSSSGEDDRGEETSAPDAQTEESSRPERGILMSFPHLELIGMELLELVTLGIVVKCERCKETVDVTGLRDSKTDSSAIKSVACKKCALQFQIGYRMDIMHANCVRAGYLDLDGCVVVDMLPSYLIPTCGECSTPLPAPGVVSVRGESTLAICRECHKRMSFKIPEIKFLQVSAAAVRASQAPRKKKERLGIKTGEQLPNRGRCSHYAKSFRWFRFSCCSKVFPCDRCHDEASDHPNEHANRMICGYCSREQNYRPEDCGVCHSSLVAKKGTGFWEGGKGTRDKTRMSRKDPRKYKRRPGTVVRG